MGEQRPAWQGPSMSATGVYPNSPGFERSRDPEKRRQANAVALFAVLFTLGGMYMIHDRQTLLSDLESRGRYTSGTVTGAYRRTRRVTTYTLKFEYHARGKAYTGSTSVSREEAERARPGDTVEVLYDPESPGRHITTSLSESRDFQKTANKFIYAFLGGYWCFAFWKLRASRRPE